MGAEEHAPERPTREALELLFELARDVPAAQLHASDNVDSKIFQSFAAAGVVLGLAASHDAKRDALTTAFNSIAIGAFLVVAGLAIYVLWSRRYRVPIGPDQLWRRYRTDEPYIIKEAFVEDIAAGYPTNEKHLKAKHKALRFVLIALLVELGAIAATLIAAAEN
jgi:hypothetical protein